MKEKELYIFIGMLIAILTDLINEPIRRHWRKQCNFNCDKCKVFDCNKHDCDRQKKKYLKKRGKDNEN